jgi:hypothetical protein
VVSAADPPHGCLILSPSLVIDPVRFMLDFTLNPEDRGTAILQNVMNVYMT